MRAGEIPLVLIQTGEIGDLFPQGVNAASFSHIGEMSYFFELQIMGIIGFSEARP
jgi:hypothetical protein